jgi:hypothetical protein
VLPVGGVSVEKASDPAFPAGMQINRVDVPL